MKNSIFTKPIRKVPKSPKDKNGALKRTGISLLIIMVAVLAAAGGWFAFRSFFSQAGVESKLPQAELNLAPADGNFDINQEFDVEIMVDTKDAKVPTAAAYLEFDSEELEIIEVVPNSKEAGFENGIFEKHYAPTTQGALKPINQGLALNANKKSWIVIAGMTGKMADTGDEASKSVGNGGSGVDIGSSKDEAVGFEGVGKLATITFKGKKDANAKVTFDTDRAAVMFPRHSGYNSIGQPNADPVDVLTITNEGNYIIGEGAVEETPAPYDLTAQGGDKKVDLNWKWDATGSAVKDAPAATYNLYRRELASGSDLTPKDSQFTKIKEGLTDKNYTDTEVTNGTTYEYYTTAVLDSRESDPSNIATAKPGVTLEVPVLSGVFGDKQVTLSWTYDSETATYKVYRKTGEDTVITPGKGLSDKGGYTVIATTENKGHLDTDVKNGTTYTYYVTATVDSEESAPSNKITGTPSESGGSLLSDIAHEENGNAVYGSDGVVNQYDFIFLMSVWTWDTKQIEAAGYTDPNVDYAKYDGKNVVTGQDGIVNAPEFIWMMNEWFSEAGGEEGVNWGHGIYISEFWAN